MKSLYGKIEIFIIMFVNGINNGVFMEPEQSGEVFWMLLSLLCQPENKQLEILGALPLLGTDLLAKHGVHNPAALLLDTMYQYYNGWRDEFEPNVKYADALFAMVNGGVRFPLTTDGFLYDESWKILRKLAKASLEEVGLEEWPVPRKIDFSKYIEII